MVIFFIYEMNDLYNPVSVSPHPVPLKFLSLAGAGLSFLHSMAFKHILQLFNKIFQCVFNCTHLDKSLWEWGWKPLILVIWEQDGDLRAVSVPDRSGGPSGPWIPTNPAAGIQHSGGLSCVVLLQMCMEKQNSDHCCFDKMPLLAKGLRNCIMWVDLFFNLVFFAWQVFICTL